MVFVAAFLVGQLAIMWLVLPHAKQRPSMTLYSVGGALAMTSSGTRVERERLRESFGVSRRVPCRWGARAPPLRVALVLP